MGRLGPTQRGLLRVAHQHHRLGCRATVADLYPTQPGGGGVSHPQKRHIDAAHLASARGPGAGPYPGVLSGLRLVEDPGAVAKPRRVGQQSADYPRWSWPPPECRCGVAAGRGTAPQATHSLRGETRQSAGVVARPTRSQTARTSPTPAIDPRNVVPTFAQKRPTFLASTPPTAELGLVIRCNSEGEIPLALPLPKANHHSHC